MTNTPIPVEAPCPDCPHPWTEHEHGGLGNGIGDGCYHRVDRDPDPAGDEKWCPCRRTPPLTALTPDQLRALVLAGRKWIGPDPEEMAARLREEHDRLARRWAAELGQRGSLLFVDWGTLADRSELSAHVRVVALDADVTPEVGP